MDFTQFLLKIKENENPMKNPLILKYIFVYNLTR